MTTTDIIASIAAGAALIGLILSTIALFLSGRANSNGIKIFKRQGVIELHMAWRDIKGIPDPSNPVATDIAHAVNALGLTAILWLFDVVDKDILLAQYWASYRALYDTLDHMANVIPGLNKTGKDMLTQQIRAAYEQMKAQEAQSVKTSRL
jgi:hypothetical protein